MLREHLPWQPIEPYWASTSKVNVTGLDFPIFLHREIGQKVCKHNNSWTAALSCMKCCVNTTTSRTLTNFTVLGQRSRSHGFFLCAWYCGYPRIMHFWQHLEVYWISRSQVSLEQGLIILFVRLLLCSVMTRLCSSLDGSSLLIMIMFLTFFVPFFRPCCLPCCQLPDMQLAAEICVCNSVPTAAIFGWHYSVQSNGTTVLSALGAFSYDVLYKWTVSQKKQTLSTSNFLPSLAVKECWQESPANAKGTRDSSACMKAHC